MEPHCKVLAKTQLCVKCLILNIKKAFIRLTGPCAAGHCGKLWRRLWTLVWAPLRSHLGSVPWRPQEVATAPGWPWDHPYCAGPCEAWQSRNPSRWASAAKDHHPRERKMLIWRIKINAEGCLWRKWRDCKGEWGMKVKRLNVYLKLLTNTRQNQVRLWSSRLKSRQCQSACTRGIKIEYEFP